MDIAERFWNHTYVSPNGCLLWVGTRDSYGYGVLKTSGKMVKAHRLAWQLVVGPIPAGMCVCHTCDNPPCVNVNHLWLGTHAQNTADKMAKGRWCGSKGRYAGTSQDHCPTGHDYTEENTYVDPRTGRKSCRICRTAAVYRSRARLAQTELI